MTEPKKDTSAEQQAAKPVDAGASAGAPIPKDENSAQAALQAVVMAAERAAEKDAKEPRPAPKAPHEADHEIKHRPVRPAARLAYAAGLVLALGLGGLAGWTASTLGPAPSLPPAQQAALAVDWSGLASGLQQSQTEAARATGDLRGLKGGVEALRDSVERSKQEAAMKLAQMAERLERAQRVDQDMTAKLASLAERLERADRDAAGRLAPIAERLDRMEKQAGTVSAMGKPTPAPAEGPAQTGSIADAKPKPAIVEGWTLHEVYNGGAVIEGPNQRLLEIRPGATIPGVGRVEAIERRGKTWTVVTGKGLITSQQW